MKTRRTIQQAEQQAVGCAVRISRDVGDRQTVANADYLVGNRIQHGRLVGRDIS